VLAGYAPFGIALLPWSKPRRILLGAVLGVVCALFAVRTLTYPLREPALWELRVAESAAVSGDSRELDTRLARARSLGAERRPETRRRLEYVERLAGRARALTRNPPDSSSSRPSSP